MGKEVSSEDKLKGIMEFYVSEYLSSKRPKIMEELKKVNYFVDPDYAEITVNQKLKELSDELVLKFHQTAKLVMSVAFSGGEALLRDFEIRFIDLVERTLLRQIDEEKNLEDIAKAVNEIANVGGDKIA